MTIPRLEAFYRHWKTSPPVHVSVAAYVGWGKSKGSAETATDADFEALMASVPQKEITP
jgi:hypothetical protein